MKNLNIEMLCHGLTHSIIEEVDDEIAIMVIMTDGDNIHAGGNISPIMLKQFIEKLGSELETIEEGEHYQ